MVVDDNAPIAVEDLAAGGENRQGFDAVAKGGFAVDFGIANLKIPEAGDQEYKDGDGKILEYGDFAGGELSVVPQRTWSFGELLFVPFGFDHLHKSVLLH